MTLWEIKCEEEKEKNKYLKDINSNLHLIIEEYKDLVDSINKNKIDADETFRYYNNLATELTSRIAKAIDYIENNSVDGFTIPGLLSILKGDEENE